MYVSSRPQVGHGWSALDGSTSGAAETSGWDSVTETNTGVSILSTTDSCKGPVSMTSGVTADGEAAVGSPLAGSSSTGCASTISREVGQDSLSTSPAGSVGAGSAVDSGSSTLCSTSASSPSSVSR